MRVGGDGVSALDVYRPRWQYSLYSAGVATTGDVMLDAGSGLELETKVHPKVRNHGEGPY